MNAKWLSIGLALFILLTVIELVRRERLTFKYASSWIMGALGVLLCAVFDQLLFRISEILGFHLASNFIFFTAIGGFTFLSLLLTVFLCQQNDRNDRMAQKIGVLELEVEQLKKRIEK